MDQDEEKGETYTCGVLPRVVDTVLDPGLVLTYYDQAIHEALALPNSPVPQGPTVAQSAEAFKYFVFQQIQTTPIRLDLNCVESAQGPGGVTYFPHLFHKMTDHQFKKGIEGSVCHKQHSHSPMVCWTSKPAGACNKNYRRNRSGDGHDGPDSIYSRSFQISIAV